ncbi:MAG: sigma-54-dependent transcriptional regulator [Nitrospinota bacterium]
MSGKPILIIDDDKSICKTLKLHFERQGSTVITAHYATEGLQALESLSSAIIILDIRLPDGNGIDLLEKIRRKSENFYSIIITAYPDMESTVKAVQSGVGEYIHKPIDIQEVDTAVENAKSFFSNLSEQEAPFIPVPEYDPNSSHFIGKSFTMKELFKTVGMVSMSKATVHITGESGTGKELVAKAIHQNSKDRNAPFISINCSAIVDTLLESELFGHARGAFTGAYNNKEGKFALAGNGTIFLDEISEMSLNLQAKLLRVLQEREFELVGGKETIKANCRIISATNNILEQRVKDGAFREDLYYRLKVINIHIPPLRDRREDIPYLVLHFLSKTNNEINKKIRYVSQDTIDYLVSREWTGNVRELENTITHVATMSRGDKLLKKQFTSLMSADMYSEVEKQAPPSQASESSPSHPKEQTPLSLNEMEKVQVKNTLEHTKWHKGKACEILGISRPRLDRKIKKYGLKPNQFFIAESM